MKIKRLYFNRLCEEFKEPKVSILLGARQVGKSTLLKMLQAFAQQKGYTTAFYDLEQSTDLIQLSGSELEVQKTLTQAAQVVFIDEFHYLKNASKIFKAIVDSKKGVKIFASGSSSLEIHKHLKESLAGRFFKTMIFPLTLEEWGQAPFFQSEHYLQWGGMPELVHTQSPDSRVRILDNIVNTYITKDVKGLIQEENIRAFNLMLYSLAQSQGSIVSASNLARNVGMREVTLARYLEIMAQTYVLHTISSYSQNLANELKKSRKYYLFDLGIRNTLLKDFRSVGQREDGGILLETAVLLELLPRLKPNMQLHFWRTKKGDEVDFILIKNRIPIPIEVKSRMKKGEIPKGLTAFLKRYPKAPFGIVLNTGEEAEMEHLGRKIFFRPWQECSQMDFLHSVL